MLLFIPTTSNGLPDWGEENWVNQELFMHLFELFKLKIGVKG